MIRRENDLILSQWYCLWFDLHNRCRQNGTKTEQEDGRNKAPFLSSQFLFLSPFLAYPLRTAAILKRANKTKTTNGRTESDLLHTNARGFWLVKKKFHARELSRWSNNALLRRYTATRLANRTMPSPIHIMVFFGGKTKSPCFELFIRWFIKQITNFYGNHFFQGHTKIAIFLLCLVLFVYLFVRFLWPLEHQERLCGKLKV